MNQRIKLPPQDWLGYDPERGDIHGYTFEQMREFAELIVEECRIVVNNLYNKTPLELCGPLLTADEEIAKHFFGVE